MKRGFVVGCITLLCAIAASHVYAADQTVPCDSAKDVWCVAPRLQPQIDQIAGATVPKLATPSWLAPTAVTPQTAVTYSVSTRGAITADMQEFKTVVHDTLNDSRGWARLGVGFTEVESGGRFTVFLTEASQMTTFSATGCDTTYSCNVGQAVAINQDRWLGATSSWIGGGGDLASYRQMVINHEVGHWLGHGHRMCGGTGQQAPLMQQQSMDLQGCTPNAWPLSAEMYSPMLGIRS